VERTVPFALFTQAIVIIWYHLAGHHPSIARSRRDSAPWYATKTCPVYIDMIVKLRRVLIAAQFRPEVPRQPTPEEIRAINLAWARQRPNRESRVAQRRSQNRTYVRTRYHGEPNGEPNRLGIPAGALQFHSGRRRSLACLVVSARRRRRRLPTICVVVGHSASWRWRAERPFLVRIPRWLVVTVTDLYRPEVVAC
jgi:hypothetical protein